METSIHSTTSNIHPELGHNEEILTDEMMVNAAIDSAKELELDGMDEREFAELVAEVISGMIAEEDNPAEFRRKYVNFVTPLLKLGGFRKLTANMTLGSLVDNNPWIGWTICGGALAMGAFMFMPRKKVEELPPSPDEIEGNAFSSYEDSDE